MATAGYNASATASLDASNGWPADQVFTGTSAGTVSFDDIVFLPGIDPVDEAATSCATKLTKNIALNLPIVGGPSATVVGVDMAIALALAGGVGIIHRNQSIEAQAEMVKRVKSFQNGFIMNPMTLGLKATVADVDQIKAEYGFGAIPITDNGKMGGKLMGLVTSRDVESLEDRSVNVRVVMTKVQDLVTAEVPLHFRDLSKPLQLQPSGTQAKSTDAEQFLYENKVGKLPVVNEDMELVALICRGDIVRTRQNPQAARDATRQLLCGASVASNEQDDWLRCQALIDAGVDVVCLDTDDGVTDVTLDFIKRLKDDKDCNIEVLAGRVSSVRQAMELLEAGVDGLSIGSFGCEGAANAFSVYEIAKVARYNYAVPVCAEGVRDATQMFKALCVGASTVTMTDMLSRCAEVPGDHIYRNGMRVKLNAADDLYGAKDRAAGLGVVGAAPAKKALAGATVDRGSANTLLPHLARQLQKGLQDLSQTSISDAHVAVFSGALRLERQLTQQRQPALDQHPCTARLVSSALHNRW